MFEVYSYSYMFKLLLLCLFYLGLCILDEECGSTEKCFNGQCVDPCQTERSCGLNALCRTENHVLQCSCPYGFTGNQDIECVRSKSSVKVINISMFDYFIYKYFVIDNVKNNC